MNLDDAIAAHAAWKQKLAIYLASPDKSINPVMLEKDNQCDLGRWIHGEGAAFASEEAYTMLKTEHAKFHRAAADVVRRADAGQSVSEEVALGNSSAYASCSSAVVRAILKMKQSAGTRELARK